MEGSVSSQSVPGSDSGNDSSYRSSSMELRPSKLKMIRAKADSSLSDVASQDEILRDVGSVLVEVWAKTPKKKRRAKGSGVGPKSDRDAVLESNPSFAEGLTDVMEPRDEIDEGIGVGDYLVDSRRSLGFKAESIPSCIKDAAINFLGKEFCVDP